MKVHDVATVASAMPLCLLFCLSVWSRSVSSSLIIVATAAAAAAHPPHSARLTSSMD